LRRCSCQRQRASSSNAGQLPDDARGTDARRAVSCPWARAGLTAARRSSSWTREPWCWKNRGRASPSEGDVVRADARGAGRRGGVRVVGGGLASMMLLAAAAARVSGRARCLHWLFTALRGQKIETAARSGPSVPHGRWRWAAEGTARQCCSFPPATSQPKTLSLPSLSLLFTLSAMLLFSACSLRPVELPLRR
jgi:hypothetical protein